MASRYMAPPADRLNLSVEDISGILGSISIACWVIVFSPQILENFRRSSADALSLQFIIIWLVGDLANIVGAVLQGVLPTMVILAIYYTIADIVLLAQCLYYRGFDWRDEVRSVPAPKRQQNQRNGDPNERTGLLTSFEPLPRERRGSDWSHLSPAIIPEPDESDARTPTPPPTMLQSVLWNTVAVLMVCAAGVAGWWLSHSRSNTTGDVNRPPKGGTDGNGDDVVFNMWGQVFGWICAVLYLGSRVPQLVLNWRRKSTEGISMLFFLFACLGNITFVLSIFTFEPNCAMSSPDGCTPGEASKIYGRYILVNLSWLAGSLGTLLLDLGIFVQFFIYARGEEEYDEEFAYEDDDEDSIDPDVWAQVSGRRR